MAEISAAKPLRRWFRFSLRTLFVVVLGFSLCGAYAQWAKHSLADGWEREQSIARRIEALGGSVAYKSITPRWLEPLLTQGERHFGERICVIELNKSARGRKNYAKSCVALLRECSRQCSDLSEVRVTGYFHDQVEDSVSGLDMATLEHELPHVPLCLTVF